MRTWRTSSGCEALRVIGGRSNVYLIRGPAATALVDTGTRANFPRLERALRDLGVSRLDYLFLTHLHFDHVAACDELRDRFGATIVLQKAAADLAALGRNEPIAGANRLTRLGYALIGGDAVVRSSALFSYRPFTPDLVIDGAADLGAFGLPGRVVPTPGHCPFAMSLVLDDEVAIVGDALFHVFPGSIMPPWAQDVGMVAQSWGRLLETGCGVFLPGHGRPIARSLLEARHRRSRGGMR
jgi:hydroxyacylglutathione hydrolase